MTNQYEPTICITTYDDKHFYAKEKHREQIENDIELKKFIRIKSDTIAVSSIKSISISEEHRQNFLIGICESESKKLNIPIHVVKEFIKSGNVSEESKAKLKDNKQIKEAIKLFNQTK